MKISMETLVDKKVFMVLRDIETLYASGLDSEHNVFVIRGHEPRHGIWVEVSSIKNCPVRSKEGLLEGIKAIIFIPWHHIVSVVHFPDVDDIEIDHPMHRKIGFRQK